MRSFGYLIFISTKIMFGSGDIPMKLFKQVQSLKISENIVNINACENVHIFFSSFNPG